MWAYLEILASEASISLRPGSYKKKRVSLPPSILRYVLFSAEKSRACGNDFWENCEPRSFAQMFDVNTVLALQKVPMSII